MKRDKTGINVKTKSILYSSVVGSKMFLKRAPFHNGLFYFLNIKKSKLRECPKYFPMLLGERSLTERSSKHYNSQRINK